MDINTILLLLLVLACPLMMFFMMKDHKHNDMKPVYICPMHPEVQEEKEGKCPKCGMNLEPREDKL